MWRLSSAFFRRGPTKFKFIGSPAKFRGPGHEISASYVLTNGFHGEPIKIHCVPGYASALYIAEYPERQHFLLLDCGCPSDFLRVKFYLEEVISKEQGAALTMKNNLRLAVSSHCHIDHSGAAMGYHEEHVPIAVASHMETSYQGFRRRLLQWVECLVVIFVAGRLGRRPENPFWYASGRLGPYYPRPPAIKELNHGDMLPFGFEDWVAVKIPGHTTHMIALYHTPSRILYTADLMVKLKKGFFSPRPVDYGWAYSSTLRRLRGLDVGYALMPHGGIVDVEDQYGSWNNIIDSVATQFRHEHDHAIPHKGSGTSLNVFLGHQIAKLLRRMPAERRHFTRADLDTGAMPQPQPKPAAVTILNQ